MTPREARTAAKLSHPNIVPVYLVEENGDLVFFVMAYVGGESLGQRVRRAGPLVPSEVNRIVREVAWALEHAHAQGVIHRDVKPDNILLEQGSGRAIVTDFGIAHLAGADSMTSKGELIGTAHYLSPEQSMGELVDGQSDLYSLGISAFCALTGKPPFDAPNVPAIFAAARTPRKRLDQRDERRFTLDRIRVEGPGRTYSRSPVHCPP